MAVFIAHGNRLKTQQGFGYLTLLFLILVMAAGIGVATERIDTILKRDKERELIFIGKQYQQALSSYYQASPDGISSLPNNLEELLSDKRFVSTKRHLRKPYLDPMTNSDWGVLRNTQRQITGVYSLSNEKFLQSPQLLQINLGDTTSLLVYSDLKFQYKANNKTQNQPLLESQNGFESQDKLESSEKLDSNVENQE